MYRKVVFSKEPTALKLESKDDAVFLQLKHATQAFSLGARGDHFGVYPADAKSTLDRAYFTVSPAGSAGFALATDQLRATDIYAPRLHLGTASSASSAASIHTPHDAPNQLHFQVAADNGLFQFGQSSSPAWLRLTSNGIVLAGDLHCRQVFTEIPHETPSRDPRPAGVCLDATGKIPREYLPEAYVSSALHPMAGVGVGIGTTVPVQKLHVEGGAFIRDRLGVGVSQPTAALHLSPPSATPGIRIDCEAGADAAPALEIYETTTPTQPVISLSPTAAVFQPPVRMTALSLNALTVPNQVYTEPHRVRFTTPVVVQAPLTIHSTLSTEDAAPLHLNAPRVLCETLESPEWLMPLSENRNTALSSSDAPSPALQPGFKGTHLSFPDRTLDLNEAAWRQAYADGDEVARLAMPDATHLSLRRLVAVLWDTVQHLTERINILEKNEKTNQ